MADFLVRRDELRDSHWSDSAPAPLAAGAARLNVDRFALTSNNVTYAAMGEAMKYWNFFPAPDGYGRVPVWGFADVVESKADGVAEGTRVYGYLPMSNMFDVTPQTGRGGFSDAASHRQGLAPIYNFYQPTASDAAYDARYEAQQMLFRPLFLTGWLLHDMLLDTAEPVAETVILSSASSKTALALAFALKQRGGVDTVGLTSEANKAWLESTGVYGRVRTYGDVDRLHARGLTAYVDFLGRPQITADVHNAMKDRLVHSIVVGVTDWENPRKPMAVSGPAPTLFFAPTYAAERVRVLGQAEFDKRVFSSMRSFCEDSVKYIKPVEVKGRDAIQKAWADLVEGRVTPDQGLIAVM